jgi:hypothetical protein
MTHLASGTALFALAFALLPSGSACFLAGSSCNCPNGGGVTQVPVPAAQSSPIADVSVNAPCTASAIDDVTVDVSTASAGGCQVLVQLTNGDTYTFSVQFVAETIHGACDCGVLRPTGGTPVPTLTDAGIGG